MTDTSPIQKGRDMLARARVRLLQARLGIIVGASMLPQAISSARTAILRWYTPARAVLAGVLAIAVILPTSLYVGEHARYVSLRESHRELSMYSTSEIATLRNRMGELMNEQADLRSLLLEAGYAVRSGDELSIPVVVTGYSSSVLETDATPFITASNTRTRTGILALSRDLLTRYNETAPVSFGDVVHISGLGDFIVEDSMNGRWRRRADIWFPDRTSAFMFGRRDVIMKVRVDNGRETAFNYTLPGNLVASGGPAETTSP